jgi:predicted CoA-binding protein
MTEPEAVLRAARSVLVVDWPSRDVPDGLAAAGLEVVVKGGPGPLDPRPEHIDLVYAYRPIGELPGIAAMANELGARTVWHGPSCRRRRRPARGGSSRRRAWPTSTASTSPPPRAL